MTKINSILDKFDISTKDINIDNAQWKTEESNETSILFYNFRYSNEVELEKFHERIENAKYSICITNSKRAIDTDNVYCFDPYKFKFFQKQIMSELYPVDFDKLHILGVTGTNGKTTTVNLIEQILRQYDQNIMTIGTLGIFLNGQKVEDFSLTTPSYIDLMKIIHKYQNEVSFFAMEMSSHALHQERFGNIVFSQIGWTNFTQDHLDYHKTMEDYFKAKLQSLDYLKEKRKIIVPRTQEELIEKIGVKVTQVEFPNKTKNLFFKPQYNKDNLAVALGMLNSYVNLAKVDIEGLNPPPGRFNIINVDDSVVVIDYAHSPDGIRSICQELRNSFKNKKLITLFGCGGDRDSSKRPLMAQAACEYSHKVFLTSDNPRFEDPNEIINDMLPGVSIEHEIIVDRKEAIKKAMLNLENSVLLIAGKGHEPYIDINGEKIKYSDLAEVQKYIND